MQTVSEILRAEIQRSGMTINAIAKAADIQVASLYRFVSRKRDLQLWTVDRVANVLGLTLTRKGKR